MEDIEDIKNKVLKVKDFLDVLKGKHLGIIYNPINNFNEQENYPLDFQIYMKEIGELSIGSRPITGDGYAVLDIIRPRTLDQMKENDFEEKKGEIPFFWFEINMETVQIKISIKIVF